MVCSPFEQCEAHPGFAILQARRSRGPKHLAVAIRIALFGQPHVLSEDGTREYVLPRKTLHVLSYMILNRRRPATRDSVAFDLFPEEEEERARGSLRRNLSYLLTALPEGRQFLSVDAERIAWNPDAPAHVDVIAFEDAVRAGRDDEAIAEYAGQLLPTIYDEWTTSDRDRLRDRFHEALVRTIARERSQRRFDAATALAHRLLEEDPWREDVVRQLISIRYEAGDRAGALAAFERFATKLRDEMAAEPMPETLALRDAVLRGARLATSEPRALADDAPQAAGLPFVGRDAAMERARKSWHAAADGRAGVLFVAGEAGAGKSRFVTELARLVEREGGLVVRGYTSAGGEHRPYEAFVEALRDAPGLLDDHMGAALSDDRAARVRLFDSVRRRLSDLSHARPIVLVLEDLHWAGAATIDLLEFVATRLERSPVLVVATLRGDELRNAHPLRALRRQLQSRGAVGEIALERLSAEDAMLAARTVFPAAAADGALERAVDWAGGLPLMLAEAMRDVAAGRATTAPDIAALVGERFARLSENAETALIFGAVLGERFDLNVLAAATGWADAELIEAVGESIEHGLLRATSRAPGLAFAFTHDLVRVAASERISPQDRTRAHGLVARALSAQLAESDARAGEVAGHYAMAGERRRAAEYWSRAARYALGVFANEGARQAVNDGLALVDDADAGQRPLRYELVSLRERALSRIGALAERRSDALLLVELAGDDPERACAALELVFEAHRDDERLRRATLKRLAAFADASERCAGIVAYATATDATLDGNFARARDAALQAADGFDRAGESRRALDARLLHVRLLERLAAFAEAQAEVDRLRPIFEENDDLSLRAEFHRVASAAANRLDKEAQLVDARRAVELSIRVGDRFSEARARHDLAVALYRLGRFGDFLNEQGQALKAFEDVGDSSGIRDSIFNLINMRTICGDLSGARALLGSLTPEMLQIGWGAFRLALVRGVLELRCERFAEAAADLESAYAHAVELGTPHYVARAEGYLAELFARTGELGSARVRIDAAIAHMKALEQPGWLAELHALSAHLHATAGEFATARDDAAASEAIAATIEPLELYSEAAWHLTAAYALAGDDGAALGVGQTPARAFAQDALQMDSELAYTYACLPWNRHAVAFLAGRQPSLRIDEVER
jgi:DNA-binding SARP family transcriptional activator